MNLKNIAARLEATLHEAENTVDLHNKLVVEHDERRMAHNIVAYVLERASTGVDPVALGSAMVTGAMIGESETGGDLACPVVDFLEDLLHGANQALVERYGGDNIVYDPIEHAVQYYLSHSKWPEDATPGTIAKAKAALASGLGGSTNNKAAYGTYL